MHQIELPLKTPKPDIERFLRVIRGEEIPASPPLVELFLDHEVIREIYRTYIGSGWVDPGADRTSLEKYYRKWIEVYCRMGYDYVNMGGGIWFQSKWIQATDTAELPRDNRNWMDEGTGPIASWEDFEKYPWPDVESVDIWMYEFVANNLPAGMGLFLCPYSGFFELGIAELLGYENACYLLVDDSELVAAVCEKAADHIIRFYKRLMGLPKLKAFFQGDDMGYNHGTMIGPEDLRKYVLPYHKQLAALAHENGLVYLLHSCGKLDDIMDDLIDDVGIDGRHSFEDNSNSVMDFKSAYGDRTATLGGIDVDKLARLPEHDLREHVRSVIEQCSAGGRFALGSGNTVCNYIPITNYFAMVEEGMKFVAS